MKTLVRSLALAAIVAAPFPTGAAEKAATSAVPPGYVPCRFTAQPKPIFPLHLLMDGVLYGEAHVVLEVDVEGKVADTLLTAYTHREFADEALRVLGEARLLPGRFDGQPVISVLNLHFVFEVNGTLVYQRLGPSSRQLAEEGDKFEYRPHGLSTMDRAPAARHTPGPIYPREWIAQGRIGDVTVDFYIDETGQTRVPVALGRPDELLAAAAISAVKEWRFEPPRRRGKPVLAHAQQTFVFKPELKSPPPPDA